jgi:predicted HicB family RNase H-like nuclease
MTRNYLEVYQAALGKRRPQRTLDIAMDVRVDPAVANALAHATEQRAISQ